MMWLLAWWPYALSHHLNPFLTNYVWAPVGFNFAWMTSTPLAAILAAPLTKAVGLVASLNVLTILAAPTAALCAFILCKRISGSFWPSMAGGFVFGFSSYMLAQTLGHLNLILVFPIPIAAYLVARWLEGSLGARRFVILLAVTLISQFLIDMEILAMATMIAAVSFAIAYRYSTSTWRARLAGLIPLTAAAYAMTAFVVSPYLYYFFAFGSIHQPLWPSERFSTDLLNFIVPTQVNLFGAVRGVARLAASFPGTLMERNGFIALPLTAITIQWARCHWKEPLCKTLVISMIIVIVAAVGPYLQIGGHPILPMPWLAFTHIPLLQHALPSRLMLFPPLAIGVIVSLWLAAPENNPTLKTAASVFALALMIPNPSANFWITRVDTPTFFTDGSAATHLTRADVVLTLPWGSTGNSMLWQAQCGMCFRNVSGYTAMERFEVRRWPIVNYFLGAADLPEPDLQLKAFLANTGVTAIVIDDANPDAASWRTLISTLGAQSQNISGVSLYRLTSDLLAAYRGPATNGAEMERRAARIRFATLVTATDKYLSAGHDPARISADELVNLALLPNDWKPAPHAFSDMRVMPWTNDGAIIMEMGSKTALTDIVDRFRDDANVIYLPFPHTIAGIDRLNPLARAIRNALLPPAAIPIDGESMEFLGIAFRRAQLHKAAGEVASAKPETSPTLSFARR